MFISTQIVNKEKEELFILCYVDKYLAIFLKVYCVSRVSHVKIETI